MRAHAVVVASGSDRGNLWKRIRSPFNHTAIGAEHLAVAVAECHRDAVAALPRWRHVDEVVMRRPSKRRRQSRLAQALQPTSTAHHTPTSP